VRLAVGEIDLLDVDVRVRFVEALVETEAVPIPVEDELESVLADDATTAEITLADNSTPEENA
jgi:hypothetical protein